MTRVSVLTPAGAGAIATVSVTGPQAWGLARWLFRTAGGKPLPDAPELHRFWVGRIADGDEVVLAVHAVEPEVCVELHGHGGRRVVRRTVEAFTARGCVESPPEAPPWHRLGLAWEFLSRAPTLRTANVLLDQAHGAFDWAVRAAIDAIDAGRDPLPILAELVRYAPVSRHLVEPWQVVVAGPPNVGKSSLVNALAGYQRAVVSPTPGTTRDVVTTTLAFDGWPVELADTAGLRDAAGLEAEGVERARSRLKRAEVILWVLDATAAEPEYPDEATWFAGWGAKWGVVVNKTDIGRTRPQTAIPVSAATGDGIPRLIAELVGQLVPVAPPPGAAVPFSQTLAEFITSAHFNAQRGKLATARKTLQRLIG